DPERVVEALRLRAAAVQWRLAALEAAVDGVAGRLTLDAAASGLATLAADAAADAALGLCGAGRGVQIVDLDRPESQFLRLLRLRRGAGRGRACRGSRGGRAACSCCRSCRARAHAVCRAASA